MASERCHHGDLPSRCSNCAYDREHDATEASDATRLYTEAELKAACDEAFRRGYTDAVADRAAGATLDYQCEVRDRLTSEPKEDRRER